MNPRHQRKRKKCKYCGKSFLIIPRLYSKTKFCSKKCFSLSIRKRVNKKCPICKKQFVVWLSQSKQVCCSIKCVSQYRILKNKKVCINCKKIFFPKPSRFKTQKCCSIKCSHDYYRGDRCYSWRGGTNKIRIKIRQSPEYTKWRKQVFKRDYYTCTKCKQKGYNLNAHHIKYFEDIIKDYDIKTFEDALQCKVLWNIKNGITLCNKCHKEIHKSMGFTEKSMQSLFTKWVKANRKLFPKTTVFELKIAKKKRLPFSRIEEHQINSLLSASIGYGDYHKISDQSMDMKPWDCQLVKGADAYIVILFYEPRKPKEYILIDINDMVDFMETSKMKSITVEEAKSISKHIIML